MPRSAELVAKLREAQRDRILEAAINVFGRGGMSATMDDVAAGAGVSHGLAYRYFAGGDPDEMLTAIAALLHGLSRLAVRGEPPFDRQRPDPSIFLRMIFPPEAKPREPSGHRSPERS
jgi:AcrR family transcriptional regulator